MQSSSLFTLGNAIRALLLFGLVAVMLVIVQSCQKPKTGLMQFSKGSLKKLTVLQAPPTQPTLTFTNASGAQMQLSDYRGKVILVNAWATWCPPCVAEMPTLDALQDARGGRDFEVVTISLDRTAAEADKWLDKEGLRNLPGWHDSTYAINDRAQLPGLPTSIFYDQAGHEVGRLAGEADWASAEALAAVDYLIGR